MKILFRGYNPIARTETRHCCISDDFQCFDYDLVKDVNLTYSFNVLVTERQVSIANFCGHSSDKLKLGDLNAEQGVVQVSGCGNKVVLLTETGELYKVICLNKNGEIVYNLQAVAKFLHSKGDKIVKIVCGAKINVALSQEGILFRIPEEICSDKIKAKDIVVGREHCVILSESGALYTFGSGRYFFTK